VFEQESEISQIIEKGLEEILAGKATVEDVIHRHPDQSEELRLELDAALWLISQREKLSPRPGFVQASRRRVVARVRQEQAARGWFPRLSSIFSHSYMRRAAQLAVVFMMILGMLMMGTGVVFASQSAVPGESLYPVKRMYEQVSISITADEVQRASLSVEFSQRRLIEAEVLVARGNFEDLETALEAYEDQVNQSVDLLLQVSEDQEAAREAAAAQMTSDLTTNAERLESLAAQVPASARDLVRHAHRAANHGASVAAAVANKQKKSTPAPTPAYTPSPAWTQLLAPGDPSTQPSQDGPGSGNQNGNNGNNGNNGSQNSNNGNSEKDKPTKEPKNNPQQGKPTPKPTNVNRPEKPTPKPTNINKPPKDNPSNSQGPPENKPTKEDKPPKDNPSNSQGPPENKPPKEDKPPKDN